MYIIVILKAIHNKDYSVVKTFRAALFRVSSSLFVVVLYRLGEFILFVLLHFH